MEKRSDTQISYSCEKIILHTSGRKIIMIWQKTATEHTILSKIEYQVNQLSK